jgi:DNA replication protein DnaC
MSRINELYDEIVRSCKKCDNGIIVKDGEFVDCECMVRFKKLGLLEMSGIPKRYREFDLRNLTVEFRKQNEKPLFIIKKYIERLNQMVENGTGLFFQSAPGLAKTALSCYILIQAIDQGYKVSFIKYEELISAFFRVLDHDKDSEDRLYYIRNSRIVCVDRIDQGYMDSDSYAYKRVDELFSHLYDHQVSLLVTSNTTRENLKFPFSGVLDELADIVFIGQGHRSNIKTMKSIVGEG